MVNIEYLIFDWGNTVMRDHALPGPMKDWEKVDNIPGIEDALKELSENYTLIIATSADHSNTVDMRSALRRSGVEDYFKFFFSAKDLGASKPDHEFFKRILLQVGCEASHTVSIGDRYLNDCVCAKRAGLHTIWFNERLKPCDHAEADRVINHMSELIEAVQSL